LLDKVEYWLELADEDVITANWLLSGKRLLPTGFFCHLTAEKALKAAIAHKTGGIPPKSHDLDKLAARGGILEDLSEEHLLLFEELMPLHVEGRYTEYKEAIAKTLTFEKCERILKETEGFLC
jgi:HEPN domain-containing protein